MEEGRKTMPLEPSQKAISQIFSFSSHLPPSLSSKRKPELPMINHSTTGFVKKFTNRGKSHWPLAPETPYSARLS